MIARRPTAPQVFFAAALLVGALVSPAPAHARQPDPYRPYQQWARVLERFVNGRGEVDLHRLVGERADLDGFLEYVARVSPRTAPALFPDKDAVLAYYINAYSALAMFNVIDSGFPHGLGGLYKVWFFGVKRFSVGGERMSLYALENDAIRPLGDARVHFALNCMSVSCPRLPREPFRADDLNRQLDDAARQFFAESPNLQLVPERKLVRASGILEFYTQDFLAHSPTLIAYIEKHASKRKPSPTRSSNT